MLRWENVRELRVVVFGRVNGVKDVYILWKPRKHGRSPFGFMRFDCKGGADREVKQCNSALIYGKSVSVSMNRFGRTGVGQGLTKESAPGLWNEGWKAYKRNGLLGDEDKFRTISSPVWNQLEKFVDRSNKV
ncbi:hypothetical protein PIB30_085456 [Stylosanthes scabra]|uniref:RRM domain-containing protein n=1 Tax=Stylosanthes scabra TaxID=79078 RepID=A0ABU6RTG1_9FABA|nr:hypothetical protein [Stylosanthes scabra]